MNDYTYKDIMRMQEEAKERVLEMRRRSRFAAENCPLDPAPEPVPEEPSAEKKAKAISCPVEFGNAGRAFTPRKSAADAKKAAQGRMTLPAALHNAFGEITADEAERMFLLALCLLLYEENGDEELILSLMYLLT